MQRQRTQPALNRHHVIGMGHLQPAIVGFDLPRDQTFAAFGQEALEIGWVGVEIDQLERAAIRILDQNAIGRPRPLPPSPAAAVLGHGDFERGQLADLGVGDAGDQGTVDDSDRQMPQQIDDPRMRPLMARRDQRVQQPLDLGPDALERADGGEQGS